MKLTRVTESGGQYQNPAVIGSHKPGVSRRGFITATGMGVGLAAVGPSLVMEAKLLPQQLRTLVSWSKSKPYVETAR